MTWGAFYMYYQCPNCGKKMKFAQDVMIELGEKFGQCPNCEIDATFVKEGPLALDGNEWEEID